MDFGERSSAVSTEERRRKWQLGQTLVAISSTSILRSMSEGRRWVGRLIRVGFSVSCEARRLGMTESGEEGNHEECFCSASASSAVGVTAELGTW